MIAHAIINDKYKTIPHNEIYTTNNKFALINTSASVYVTWSPANLYIWNIHFVNWKHILYTMTVWLEAFQWDPHSDSEWG